MENRVIKFRRVDGFDKYEVGDDGSIFSLDYNHSGKRRKMKQYHDRDGYLYVFFVVNGKRTKHLSHRIVCKEFHDNPENKPQVNHKNGVRDDNRSINLEWATAKENCIHAFKENGRILTEAHRKILSNMYSGANNPKAKVNEAIVLSIRRRRKKGESLKSISEAVGLSMSQVSSITTKRTWNLK